MDVTDAARRWAGVWERAWAAKDVDAIVALLRQRSVAGAGAPASPNSVSPACGPICSGPSAKEDDIEGRFGEPVATPVCPSDDVAVEGAFRCDRADLGCLLGSGFETSVRE
jgi:hypothetical protein